MIPAPRRSVRPAPQPPREKWSFAGMFGRFDQAQLQRGFQVYKEVCANCHAMKLVAFRNLSEEGGPGFSAAQVKALHDRILPALHGAGLQLERRRFRPHVTLARFDRTAQADHERLARFLARNATFPSPPFRVEDFALWRSTLLKAGAVHDELARYPLT